MDLLSLYRDGRPWSAVYYCLAIVLWNRLHRPSASAIFSLNCLLCLLAEQEKEEYVSLGFKSGLSLLAKFGFTVCARKRNKSFILSPFKPLSPYLYSLCKEIRQDNTFPGNSLINFARDLASMDTTDFGQLG